MYDIYIKNGSRKAKRGFQYKFQDVTVQHRRTIHRIVNKDTATLVATKPESKHCVINEEKNNETGSRLQHIPQKFLHPRPVFQNHNNESLQNF
jgi:hypothetical protein